MAAVLWVKVRVVNVDHGDGDGAAGVGAAGAGQLCLAVAEVTVLARILLPVSGLFTVTVKVMVAAAPTARFPVQVRFGLA